MVLQLGQTVGDYELIDIIESSKRRVAYRVRNLETGAFEQLQILPEVLQKDPVRTERFLREIRILAGLSHRNILTCYRPIQVNGQWAMTLELLEGVTLAERLELGPLPAPEAVAVMGQLLSAVVCAHSRGIVHREITPRNVVLTPDHVVKLTGFTYAKGASDAGLTQVGAIIGDVEYMSPEQVRGVEGVDARSDIYSLGALFYTLLVGKPPFQAASQFDVMMAQVRQEAVPPSHANSRVPPALDPLVMRALAKHPENRYQSAWEFLAKLEMTALSLQVDVWPAPKPLPAQAPAIDSTGEAAVALPSWLVVTLASVLALTAGVLMFLVLRWVN